MKTLTNITVNGWNQDAVIEHYPTEFKTPDNKVVWADEKNCIAKCHQDARAVTIYVKHDQDGRSSNITLIDITANSIKQLYQKIIEIEKQTSEEFID